MVATGNFLGGVWAQAQDNITAKVGGTQSDSPQLVYGWNRVTVSANDTDGVVLPPAKRRAIVWLLNDDSAQDVIVFGDGDDTINGTAGATGVAQGQQIVSAYVCLTTGAWQKMFDLTAA